MYCALPKKLRRSQHVRLGWGWSKVTVCRPLPGGYAYPPTAPAAEMSELEILSHGNDHHVFYIRRCKIISVIAMHDGHENGNKTFERIEHDICHTGNSCAKRRRGLIGHQYLIFYEGIFMQTYVHAYAAVSFPADRIRVRTRQKR